MVTDRRTALAALAGALAAPWTTARAGVAGPAPLWIGAWMAEEGDYRAGGFGRDGGAVFDLPLPGRGHSFAVHPVQPLVASFARRPGTFLRVIDIAAGVAVADVASRDGTHFYGHGTYSRDGRLLYATENDIASGRGMIGVYDADDGYRRVGAFPTGGIGPHDVRLIDGGATLVVANGGILTDPELPRIKLNVPDMAPSLAYLDHRDGRVLEQVALPSELHQLSIRHLAIAADGAVAVAMQYEGPAGDLVPLVALHRRGDALRPLVAPEGATRAMRQYCGSTAFDGSGRILAVSAPRGNRIVFWDAADGSYLGAAPVADGCGIAASGPAGEFIASSGAGGVFRLAPGRGDAAGRLASAFLDRAHWDNHLVSVVRRA